MLQTWDDIVLKENAIFQTAIDKRAKLISLSKLND